MTTHTNATMSNEDGEADHVSPQKTPGRKIYNPRSMTMPTMGCKDPYHDNPKDLQAEYEERKWCTHPFILLERRNGTLDKFHQRQVKCTHCDPKRRKPEPTTAEYLAKMEEEAAKAPPLTLTQRMYASAKRKTKRAITGFLDARHGLNGSASADAPGLATPGIAPPPKFEQKLYKCAEPTMCGDREIDILDCSSVCSLGSDMASRLSYVTVPAEDVDWQAIGNAQRMPSFGEWVNSKKNKE